MGVKHQVKYLTGCKTPSYLLTDQKNKNRNTFLVPHDVDFQLESVLTP